MLRFMLSGLLVISLLDGALFGAEAEKPVPVMPREITLTSGRVLRDVQVIRWESNRVVLKHAAGVDPIAFSLIKSPTAAELKAMQQHGLAQAKVAKEIAKLTAENEARAAEIKALEAEADKRAEEAREEASRSGRLMKGQTFDQVRMAIGYYPVRQNEYDSGRQIQAIYERVDAVYYCYFTTGRLTSWQKSDPRR